MSGPTSTLRSRKPPAPDPPKPDTKLEDTPKNAPSKSTTSSILSIVFLVSAVLGLLALAGVAGLTLYRLNPGGYFRPIPGTRWFAVPGEEETWVVDLSADVEKRDAVVAAFKHAWLAYERDAMGDDEYHPIARKGSNLTAAGGVGYTVVDSLDTMLIMGLDEEYTRARRWVEESLTFERDAEFSVFETTIRILGGLLSAFALTDETDTLLLARAAELADRLLPAFSSPSGLPYSLVNLATRAGAEDPGARGLVSTAEATTLQLEFRYLAHLTEKEEYWERVEEVMRVVRRAAPRDGLAPIFMNMNAGKFVTSEIRLGSRGDSYYEYLLKQYLQTGGVETVYREMYDDAMRAIDENLLVKSNARGLTFTQEVHPRRDANTKRITWVRIRKQDHLACFLAGSLMLGATTAVTLMPGTPVSIPPRRHELAPHAQRDWANGAALLETCVDTYRGTATGLSPEIVHFRETIDGKAAGDWYIKGAKPPGEPPVYDARYILRPETVESLFLAWRLTGHPRYRAYGWDIFQAIEKHCRVPGGGYASVLNVEEVPVTWEDKMETFLLSETFKYLYLLFADSSVIPLDEYVFNTEAHPLPIFSPGMNMGAGPGAGAGGRGMGYDSFE